MPHTALALGATTVAPGHSQRCREVARLFERYRRMRDPNTRAELVARFLPLAKRLARRYQDRDDVRRSRPGRLARVDEGNRPLRPRSRGDVCRVRGSDDRGRAQAPLPRPHVDRARAARAARSGAADPERVGAADGKRRAIAHARRGRRDDGVQRRAGARGHADRERPAPRQARWPQRRRRGRPRTTDRRQRGNRIRGRRGLGYVGALARPADAFRAKGPETALRTRSYAVGDRQHGSGSRRYTCHGPCAGRSPICRISPRRCRRPPCDRVRAALGRASPRVGMSVLATCLDN